MSRRDLIIISALINAGLLIVLFATALKSDPAGELITKAPSELSVPSMEKLTKKEKEKAVVAAGDEVDQVLKEFAARAMPRQTPIPSEASKRQEIEVMPSFAPIATTETTESKKEKRESPPSFAEELAAQYPTQVTLPPPAQKKVTQTDGKYAEVQIRKGDYLDMIARRNGTSVSEIMRINHLTTTNLKIGQILKIPTKKAAVTQRATAASASSEDHYVVQDGDNPWTIARKNQISVSELLRLNHLDDRSARRLKPGDRLRTR